MNRTIFSERPFPSIRPNVNAPANNITTTPTRAAPPYNGFTPRIGIEMTSPGPQDEVENYCRANPDRGEREPSVRTGHARQRHQPITKCRSGSHCRREQCSTALAHSSEFETDAPETCLDQHHQELPSSVGRNTTARRFQDRAREGATRFEPAESLQAPSENPESTE